MQEMGQDFLGFAPGWSETEIKEILRDWDMVPLGK